MVAFKVVLPTAERVTTIRELRSAGHRVGAIAARVFGTHRHGKGWVREILASSHDFDPYVDQVAVDRALLGDAAVWESLTHYERRDVMLAVHERWTSERAENVRWKQVWGGKRGTNFWTDLHPPRPEWVAALADGWGLTSGRLLTEARRYAEAA